MKLYQITIGIVVAAFSSSSFAGEGDAHDTGPLRAAMGTMAVAEIQDNRSSESSSKHQFHGPMSRADSGVELFSLGRVEIDAVERDAMLKNGQESMAGRGAMGGR